MNGLSFLFLIDSSLLSVPVTIITVGMCRTSRKEAVSAKFSGERKKKSNTDKNAGGEGESDVLIQKKKQKNIPVWNLFSFNPEDDVGLEGVHPTSSLQLTIVLTLSHVGYHHESLQPP